MIQFFVNPFQKRIDTYLVLKKEFSLWAMSSEVKSTLIDVLNELDNGKGTFYLKLKQQTLLK